MQAVLQPHRYLHVAAAAAAACPLHRAPTHPLGRPTADDSSLLAVVLDVSPASLAHIAATPGFGLQPLIEQVGYAWVLEGGAAATQVDRPF